jgi:multidrug efflux pump subunit AcrA (membrane-fusion protein)
MVTNKRTTLINWFVIAGLCLVLLNLSACSSPPPETPTTDAPSDAAQVVSATGIVVPPQQAMLSFTVSGTVVEILVKEGDAVKKGDMLARMDTTQLDASVKEAEAALLVAQANYERSKVGPRPEEIEQAQNDLAAAMASVAEAVAQREQSRAGASEAEILQAQADLQAAFLNHKLAQDSYNVKNGTATNTDPDYVETLPENGLPIDPDAVESAQEALDSATGDLEAAQAYLDELLAGPDTTDLQLADARVWVAGAEQAAAEAYVNLLLAGPRPESISVSEAQMLQAQAALNAAKANRDKAILLAPFDGVISDVSIQANEWANPGQQIALMASSGDLLVETTDLNEIDVARVREGDTVTVTFDALPGVTVSGKVLNIASRSSEGAGVNYTVRISLDEIPEALRWGMTAFVDIHISE